MIPDGRKMDPIPKREGEPMKHLCRASWLTTLCCALVALIAATIATAGNVQLLTANTELVVGVSLVRSLPPWMTAADRGLATEAANLIRNGKQDQANALWRRIAQEHARAHGAELVDTVGKWILREGLLASHTDFNEKASQFGRMTELRAALGTVVLEMRDVLHRMPAGNEATTTVKVREVHNGQLVETGSKAMTRPQIETHIKHLEREGHVLKDSLMPLVSSLEEIASSQAQTVQTIANVMKLLHDTLMTVIQNTKA
jgi:hypothetical protein